MPVDTATSDVSSHNDSLVTVSDGEITSNSNESTVDSNISEHSSKNSNVMANTSTTKENISESNVMKSTSTIKDNISNTKNSNVKDNVSKSENDEITNSLTNSGTNLVSPGSSLNSVSLSGGAEVPLSSVGNLDSVRVSNVPSGLRLPKGSGSGVSRPAAARPSGLRPGPRKVMTEWSLAAKRKR